MTYLSRRAALLLLAAASVAACESTTSKPTPTASTGGDMSPNDLDFVANAFNIIEFDRRVCTSAQRQATSPEVRAIAMELLEQANAFDARLQPVAARAGIKPPTALRTNLRIRAGRLELGQGRNFDRAFIEDEIYSHQDAINLQQMMIDDPNANPQLKELSGQGMSIVQSNLDKLRALQRKLMGLR